VDADGMEMKGEQGEERLSQPLPELPSDAIMILPVRETVLFPGVILPITVGRRNSIEVAQRAVKEQRQIGILMQRSAEVADPAAIDMHTTGVICNVVRYITTPDGSHHLVCQGEHRFRVREFLNGWPFMVARVTRIEEQDVRTPDIEARYLNLQRMAVEALQLLPQTPSELIAAVQSAGTPGALADLVSAYLDMKPDEKQEVLETIDIAARIDRVTRLLAGRIEVLRISAEIGQQTKVAFDERQREAVLREQMAAIQRQLGEGDGKAAEVEELNRLIAEAGMPAEVEEQAKKELRRLERTPEAAAEYGMIRGYLDWLIELPWKLPDEKPIDIAAARRILDEDHFGLEKIKQRIIEYLAVRKLTPSGRAPILCFVGPPGVGKTSLGQSIARAMNRKFVRISLGGVRDEAEIRGHRRTYIGSMPGRIAQALKTAGSSNPVLMLDEIDKISVGIQGDPAAALLEVLDPAQNHAFRDHYLEIPLDLSRVLFIATANQLGTIHPALLDRMEMIPLSGYTEDEKVQIARLYLVPRQREEHGLRLDQFEITDAAVRRVIGEYTREAGVRTLERQIGTVARKVAAKVAADDGYVARVDAPEIPEYLGPARFRPETSFRTSRPGVATGLAWTETGGDVLFIEAALLPGGNGQVILTGQLGSVMQESARAALSHVRQHAHQLGVTQEFLSKQDIHIHVPAGAIPKDGPSAGVTMATAMVSAARGVPVRSDVAMTGEITLSGLVLPVGGIREKTLAARRHGIRTIILPELNEPDLVELPEEVRKDMTFHPVGTLEQALSVSLPLPVAAAVDEP
jgi:ATP-dependent Lon protease